MLPIRNYNVCTNIGITTSKTRRFKIVLNNGACSSFIRPDEISHQLCSNIEPLGDDVTFQNARWKSICLLVSIFPTIPLWPSRETVHLFVADELDTAIILGFNNCNLHVDGIRPLLKIFRMDDGSMIPVKRQPSPTRTEVPLPEKLHFDKTILYHQRSRQRHQKLQLCPQT